MKDTERIYALLIQANPIPDPDGLTITPNEAELLEAERSLAMETQQSIETSQPQEPRSRRPSLRRRLAVGLAPTLLVVAVGGVALFMTSGNSDVADDRIVGTWHWPAKDAYERLDANGEWGYWPSNPQLIGNPYDWGTYTFDGETLTYYNAEDSYCRGAVALYTVEFHEEGTKAVKFFVSDTCDAPNVFRDQGQVVYKQPD